MDTWDKNQKELNLSYSISCYGPASVKISNIGKFNQDENLRNILSMSIINYCEENQNVKRKKFSGNMEGLEYCSIPANEGFGFGCYINKSEKRFKVGIVNRRKHLQVSKFFYLIFFSFAFGLRGGRT